MLSAPTITRCRYRNDSIEVASGQRIAQTEVIREECLNESKVGPQCHLEQIARSIDFDHLLAGSDRRPDAGMRQDAAEAVTTRADALDQRA